MMRVAVLAGSLVLGALPAYAQDGVAPDFYDLTNPEDALSVMRKINCSTRDNEPIFFSWQGEAFSRRRGEADRKLFKVVGMNVRQCVTIDGGKRGMGYRMVSREIMLYQDPVTAETLDTWHNPWTGEDVDVLHVQNDPVNGRPTFSNDTKGNPYMLWGGRLEGNNWTMTLTIPLFYQNVLGGDYQKYVGGAYHATEMFNFMGTVDDLIDLDKHTAENVRISWVRIAQWLPWMEMQGRDGLLYFHAASQKIPGFDDLPEVLKEFITEKAPKYAAPPPGDDARPNATSWTVFMDTVAGEKLPRGGAN